MDVWEQIRLDPENGSRSLVAEYGDRLFGAAVMLCHDSGVAEDLVFRTFERAVERIALYDSELPFWNWLYSILLNFFRMDMRKNKAFVPEDASFVADALEAESGGQMLSLGDGGCFGAPKFPSGTFDVSASVGDADGTSVYELPIGGSDGHRRDKIGHCRFR